LFIAQSIPKSRGEGQLRAAGELSARARRIRGILWEDAFFVADYAKKYEKVVFLSIAKLFVFDSPAYAEIVCCEL
jgi:hypothetical protein